MKKLYRINDFDIFPLGLGSFGFGEEALKLEGISEEEQKKTLSKSIELGINYIVIYLTYANGNTARLLKEVINGVNKDLYLTFCSYPSKFTNIKDLKKAFDLYNKDLNTNKFKTFMLSSQMEGRFGREASTKLLKQVLDEGIESLGLTNCNLEQLNHYYNVFGNKIVVHELCHNFEIRIFEELGILQRTRELGIQPVTYQPLRRNRTAIRKWPLLEDLAIKYNVSVNQIILNWLVSIGVMPLIKSIHIDRIKENIDSLSFELESQDIEAINNFKIDWKKPKIDWLNFDSEDPLYVAKLPNVFDEIYDRSHVD